MNVYIKLKLKKGSFSIYVALFLLCVQELKKRLKWITAGLFVCSGSNQQWKLKWQFSTFEDLLGTKLQVSFDNLQHKEMINTDKGKFTC